MRVVDAADLLVGRLCPYVAGGIGVGSLYWTCVTFGAVTVMQVRIGGANSYLLVLVLVRNIMTGIAVTGNVAELEPLAMRLQLRPNLSHIPGTGTGSWHMVKYSPKKWTIFEFQRSQWLCWNRFVGVIDPAETTVIFLTKLRSMQQFKNFSGVVDPAKTISAVSLAPLKLF
jgi:hypothetical protein